MKILIIISTSLMITLNCLASVKIIGGQIDEIKNANGVIHLAIRDSVESGACTATKIAENYIITAAHCFHGKEITALGMSTLSINPSYKFTPLEFDQIIMYPEFEKLSTEDVETVGITFATPDIAIVRVIPSEEFKKLKVVEINYEFIGINESVELWGYGCQKTINDISHYIPTRKRASTKTVGEVNMRQGYGIYNEFYQSYSKKAYEVSLFTIGKSKENTKPSLCLGDSGGTLIHNNKIIGVNSNYTFNDLDSSGTLSGISYLNLHSRISFVSSWIKEIIEE